MATDSSDTAVSSGTCETEQRRPTRARPTAKRRMLASRQLDDLVHAMLREHINAILAAAKSGQPPLIQIESTVLQLLSSAELSGTPASKALTHVAGGIEESLKVHGYSAVRAEPIEFGPQRINTFKVYFLRLAELDLFELVDRGEPVSLAMTTDAKRFARALVRRFLRDRESRPKRRIFVWTIASGLFELVERDGGTVYLPAGSPELYAPEVALKRLSVECELRGEDRRSIMMDVVAEASSGGILGVNDHRIQFFKRVVDADSLAPIHSVLLDDFDGDEPLKLSEMDLGLLEARFSMDGTKEHAERDRWPLVDGDGKPGDRMSMHGLLDFIMQRQTEGALFILHDTEIFLNQGAHDASRAHVTGAFLRDACIRLRRGAKGTQIVALSAPTSTPPSLVGEIAHLDLPLPSRLELLSEIRTRASDALSRTTPDSLPKHPLQATDEMLNVVDAAAGMTLSDVVNAIRTANRSGNACGGTIVQEITRAKSAAIRQSAALELVDREPPRKLRLGGMEQFERWLQVRHRVFTHPELASQVGINQRPKGVLILGIPGTGKSLAAKLIAREWSLPLVRLDMGAIQNRWLGASEERIREALQIVEAMSPCVLWIDEIDKGISQGEGANTHSAHQNVRATLLTWLQENESAVFVVATANRFSNLPPELTRAGRFDARFFFGCPNSTSRREILDIHLDLRRPGVISADESMQVAEGMVGFTGAEIEQTVLDALYVAFSEDRPPAAADLVAAASRVKPLVRAIGKGLDEVWALIEQGRVELASNQFLTRADLARLIDPESFSPMYCRLERIEGWERHCERATRILMRDQLALPAAVVLKTGDDDWAYVQTNVRMEATDSSPFKFLDRLRTMERNGILDVLVVQCGIEKVWFEDQKAHEAFMKHSGLAGYSELFEILPQFH